MLFPITDDSNDHAIIMTRMVVAHAVTVAGGPLPGRALAA